MEDIRLCKKCGFILGTRPSIKDIDGVCMPCINNERKKAIDFAERQEWLTDFVSDSAKRKNGGGVGLRCWRIGRERLNRHRA